MFLATSCVAYSPHALGHRVPPAPAAVSVRMETPCDTRYGGFEPDWLIDGVKASGRCRLMLRIVPAPQLGRAPRGYAYVV